MANERCDRLVAEIKEHVAEKKALRAENVRLKRMLTAMREMAEE